MSVTELARFLDEERVLTCATLGPTGRPHLMPLWYVRDGPTLYAWTYGKSQKVRNLEREPRATVQIEAGRDRYGELRGVIDRKSTRLNSSHTVISYAVFCLKKKNKTNKTL